MNKFLFALFFTAFLPFCSQSQWTPVTHHGFTIKVLKSIKGSLFAFAIHNISSEGRLIRSNDDGSTWIVVDSVKFKFIYITDITYDSTNNLYVTCTTAQKGIFNSPDGNTWTNTGANWGGNGITYINSRLVLSDANNGIGRSTDGGTTWTLSNAGLPAPYYVHNVTRFDDTLYLSNQGKPVYISYNYGANWYPRSDSLTYFADCLFKHDNTLYAGLYLNGAASFNGSYWNAFKTGLPSTNNVWAMCDNGDSLFCGGDSIGVWMSVANGNWQKFACGLPMPRSVNQLLRNNSTLFAGTDSGIFKINLITGCNGNGIYEPQVANQIEVYPSITHNSISIRSATLPKEIQVINGVGQLLQVQKETSKISVENYIPGIYFLRITISPEYVVIRKFVVN